MSELNTTFQSFHHQSLYPDLSQSTESPAQRSAKPLGSKWSRGSNPSLGATSSTCGPIPERIRLVGGSSVREGLCEESDDAILVFRGRMAESRGMLRPGYNPEFLRAVRGLIDSFGVAARNSVIASTANQKSRKGPSCYRLLGGNVIRTKAARFGHLMHSQHCCWTEKRSSQKRTQSKAGVVVAHAFSSLGWVLR